MSDHVSSCDGDTNRRHQIPQVGGEHAQLQAHVVGAEPVARQPRPVRCLLAFLVQRFRACF
jgi:hypothetical protein